MNKEEEEKLLICNNCISLYKVSVVACWLQTKMPRFLYLNLKKIIEP